VQGAAHVHATIIVTGSDGRMSRSAHFFASDSPGAAGEIKSHRRTRRREDGMDNPDPTETEEELAQTDRQAEEEDMRGTTDPEEQD
jgi:hypothetical protein